jgi:hypothetical protein
MAGEGLGDEVLEAGDEAVNGVVELQVGVEAFKIGGAEVWSRAVGAGGSPQEVEGADEGESVRAGAQYRAAQQGEAAAEVEGEPVQLGVPELVQVGADGSEEMVKPEVEGGGGHEGGEGEEAEGDGALMKFSQDGVGGEAGGCVRRWAVLPGGAAGGAGEAEVLA